MTALAIGLGWLLSIAVLLVIAKPSTHPREWGLKVWALVLLAPFTMARATFRRLRWAHRIRTLYPPPYEAIFRPGASPGLSDFSEWQNAKVRDGAWFVRSEDGRRVEVTAVHESFGWWWADTRAVDPRRFELEDGYAFDSHEYHWLTVQDVHEGRFTPYIPPEIASLLHDALEAR